MELADLRNNFGKYRLLEAGLPANPLVLFEKWLQDALQQQIQDFNAMVLSTVYKNKPSSRVVLLKEITETGRIVFFTNYESRKGKEIAANNAVALNLFWSPLERQVRIEGKATRVSGKVSEMYFNSRPAESRAGAIVSPQSRQIDDIEPLRREAKALLENEKKLIIPSHWGGFQVNPTCFEFWQGGPDRLHDRIVFKKKRSGWQVFRLAP